MGIKVLSLRCKSFHFSSMDCVVGNSACCLDIFLYSSLCSLSCVASVSSLIVFFLCQNVPPSILLRFLREHRSEWADSGIDAYSAAAVKAGPCSIPVTRTGSFGGQIILPLAHTIEHEEASDFFLIISSISRTPRSFLFICIGYVL